MRHQELVERLQALADEMAKFLRNLSCGSTAVNEMGEHLCVDHYVDERDERNCKEARRLLALLSEIRETPRAALTLGAGPTAGA